MSAIPGDFSKPTECKCYVSKVAKGPLEPSVITRRACSYNDVVIGVKFAGICHSDIHQVKEEWGPGNFPMVPGHEIGGVVLAVGKNVTKFTVGQHVGVGCIVDSCRSCDNCRHGEENYCAKGMVGTYNSKHKYAHCVEYNVDGGAPTYGGYSQTIVVDHNYVLSIPENLDLAAATPLLCAGITTYSPLMHFGLKPNQTFAVNGLGGLGHMAAKFGVAWGADTTIISRGTGKKAGALAELKVHHFIDSTNEDELKESAGKFDFILDTVSAVHDIPTLVGLLKTNGKLILVGAPPGPLNFSGLQLIMGRKTIAASLIGGIQETQEMLDFCGRHNITCDIEMISADQINVAYERTLKSDVKYRFVIDNATL